MGKEGECKILLKMSNMTHNPKGFESGKDKYIKLQYKLFTPHTAVANLNDLVIQNNKPQRIFK